MASTDDSVRWLELRGRDYPQLGPVGAASLDGGGAVILSRGAYRKSYSHVDPNEDGVLLYQSGPSTLLCVVDGHNGARASEVGLDQVRQRADDFLAADGDSFGACVTDLLHAVGEGLAAEKRSRSCLLLAVRRAGDVRWVSLGDCSLYRATREEPVNPENPLLLQRGLPATQLPQDMWTGRFDCPSGERIALVTDGITNFVPDPRTINRMLGDAPDDAAAARALAESALSGGAGDNVAIATCST
jgi:serine/threonine protein phosphatase PrpC